MTYPRSLFGPLLLITVGAIWLLVQSGNIPAGNLWALTHIWPYLLIAAGLGIILRSYWRYTPIFMDIVVLGGAVLAIVFAPKLGWANPTMISVMNNGNFFVGPGESGSGNVVTETRTISNFNSVHVDYPAQVFISQGTAESVKVEAEDNLLPGLKTEVRNKALEIFYKSADGRHINTTRPVKITIVVKDLSKVDFSSAGELTIGGVKSEKLQISLGGAGDVKLNDIAIKTLSVDLNGAGSMAASGKADALTLNISGFGSFAGKDLHSQTVHINLSGAGSATVWADKTLSANISGAGSVSYYGSPAVTKQISGVGGVQRLGNR